MNFIVKPHIEELLNKTIKNRNIEGQHKMIIELKSVLQLISFIESHSNEFNGIKSIHGLPPSKTGYSEYRVMDDTESEDPSMWVEINGLRLSEGDILLEMK